jgi:hypothetical protein
LARAVLCAALATLPATGVRGDGDSPVRFSQHVIDIVPGAYHLIVADMNGDGKPDVVVVTETDNVLSWYENPTWTKHVVTTALSHNIDVAACDVEKRGRPDLFVASSYAFGGSPEGGRIIMLSPGADANAEWIATEIGRDPCTHRLRFADWDGNGRKELVAVPLIAAGAPGPYGSEPVEIRSYAFSGFEHRAPAAKRKITMEAVDRSLHLAHGACVCDFDGNGREDLLVASLEGVTLFRPIGKGTSRTWSKTLLAEGRPSPDPTKRGCSEIDRGWLRGRRPFLATIEPWHGNEVVVYLPTNKPGAPWSRHVIDDTIEDGHALVCVDLDADGQSEIVAGGRGGSHNLYGYRCTDRDGLKWERFVIDAGDMSAAGVVACDLFGTRRPDLVAPARVPGKVKVYENLGR